MMIVAQKELPGSQTGDSGSGVDLAGSSDGSIFSSLGDSLSEAYHVVVDSTMDLWHSITGVGWEAIIGPIVVMAVIFGALWDMSNR